jgi:hypothetical protein
MRMMATVTLAALLTGSAAAQETPKPGPEHKMLKKLEGTWDTLMKVGGKEYKGVMTYKMELGGLWLVGALESDFDGHKFYGKSLDSYDAGKKKFVSVWCDSMLTLPLVMEGGYNKESKTMTLVGEMPGMDGKPARWKAVSEMKDDDTIHQSLYLGDGKEPMFTITYKRKK